MFVRMVCVTLVVTMVSSLGCTITRQGTVPKDDFVPGTYHKITGIKLIGGGTVDFVGDEGGLYSADDRTFKGESKSGEVEYKMDEVESINVERVNDGLSIAASFGGILVLNVALLYVIAVQAQWASQ